MAQGPKISKARTLGSVQQCGQRAQRVDFARWPRGLRRQGRNVAVDEAGVDIAREEFGLPQAARDEGGVGLHADCLDPFHGAGEGQRGFVARVFPCAMTLAIMGS